MQVAVARSGPSGRSRPFAVRSWCHEYVGKSLYKSPGSLSDGARRFIVRGSWMRAASKSEDLRSRNAATEDEVFWREFLRSLKSLGWPGG